MMHSKCLMLLHLRGDATLRQLSSVDLKRQPGLSSDLRQTAALVDLMKRLHTLVYMSRTYKIHLLLRLTGVCGCTPHAAAPARTVVPLLQPPEIIRALCGHGWQRAYGFMLTPHLGSVWHLHPFASPQRRGSSWQSTRTMIAMRRLHLPKRRHRRRTLRP